MSDKEVISTGSIKKPPLSPPPTIQAPEPGTITTTARRLHDYLIRATKRPLPESWINYRNLDQQVEPLNFQALASVLAATIERMSGYLPEPEDFFTTYDGKAPTKKRKKRKRKAA